MEAIVAMTIRAGGLREVEGVGGGWARRGGGGAAVVLGPTPRGCASWLSWRAARIRSSQRRWRAVGPSSGFSGTGSVWRRGEQEGEPLESSVVSVASRPKLSSWSLDAGRRVADVAHLPAELGRPRAGFAGLRDVVTARDVVERTASASSQRWWVQILCAPKTGEKRGQWRTSLQVAVRRVMDEVIERGRRGHGNELSTGVLEKEA